MMVDLQQVKTGFVADDFFLMANDDPSGRPRLSERILALGLAPLTIEARWRNGIGPAAAPLKALVELTQKFSPAAWAMA